MGKTAFFINHGVEVRQFLLSGLAENIKESRDVCLLTTDIQSTVLEEYIIKFGIERHIIPKIIHEKYPWEKYIRVFTNARKRSENVAIYSHFGGVNNDKKWFDFIFQFEFVKKIFEFLFRGLVSKFYFKREIANFLNMVGVDTIYVLDFDDSLITSLAATANKMGIKVNVAINTLKTVFINDFISFYPNSVYTWNNSQNTLFQAGNKLIKKSSFKPVGNAYHNFLNTVEDTALIKFKKKYDIPEGRKIILYSLINEKVFEKEYLIIELINNFINSLEKLRRPIIFVRRNPFEQNDFGIEKIAKLNNVIIMDHYWERDLEKNWSIQTIEGENEWKNIIHLSSISMNIPSMSTIDSIICGIPVITIGFNEYGESNSIISHVINSPFSDDFSKSDFVLKTESFKKFQDSFGKFISLKDNSNKQKIQNSLDISLSELGNYVN